MRTYPIMLSLAGRRAVVVGAGSVGLRKVRSLLAVGAAVRLVDPAATDAPDGDVEIRREPYRAAHLAGAAIVFGCTDDAALNARITADARRIGALVNAADQPEDCDFFLPAVVGSGEVVVAIGTGGASPALAGWIRDKVAGVLPKEIGEFAAALADIRTRLRHEVDGVGRRGEILKKLACDEAMDAFRAGGREALDRMVQRIQDESETDAGV